MQPEKGRFGTDLACVQYLPFASSFKGGDRAVRYPPACFFLPSQLSAAGTNIPGSPSSCAPLNQQTRARCALGGIRRREDPPGNGCLANRARRSIVAPRTSPHPVTLDPKSAYWLVKLEKVKAALEGNGFTVSLHDDPEDAARHVAERILPLVKPRTVGFGGSQTVVDSGVLDLIRKLPDVELMDALRPGLSAEEVLELRRRMLLADLYLASSNALTLDGKLVNCDGSGNRVASLHFGPRKVVLLVGRNKICASVDEGITRIKTLAAPMNNLRLRKDTPCVKTGLCMNCKSPGRICSVWTITEKCFPAGRIHIQLIKAEAGF